MKKFTGNYSADAGKALKSAGGRLFCRVDDDGMIYTCNGFLVYRMNPIEYATTVQPVTKCDAGNWIIENGEKRDASPADFDVIKAFREAVNACTGETLNRCPLEVQAENGSAMVSFYSSAAGFAAFYNRLCMAALLPGLTIRANSAISPAVFYSGEEAVAMVLPVKAKPDAARAVKAYFTADQGSDETPNENRRRADLVQAYEAEAAELRETITKQAAELASLRAELDKLHAEQAAAPVEQAADETPAEDVKSAAEIIAARCAGLDGVRAVIKGAQTAAPVVWLAGDTEKHADAIRAAGAKWSGKKGAYYIRVA